MITFFIDKFRNGFVDRGHSNYIDIVKTCIRDTLSEYYSVGNIDDFLHVELLCNDQVFF
jgi:hypothetical protein